MHAQVNNSTIRYHFEIFSLVNLPEMTAGLVFTVPNHCILYKMMSKAFATVFLFRWMKYRNLAQSIIYIDFSNQNTLAFYISNLSTSKRSLKFIRVSWKITQRQRVTKRIIFYLFVYGIMPIHHYIGLGLVHNNWRIIEKT